MDLTFSLGNIVTIVSLVVGLGTGWGVIQQQVREHTKRLAEHDKRITTVTSCELEIKIKLAEIARDILYIRERLDKEQR